MVQWINTTGGDKSREDGLRPAREGNTEYGTVDSTPSKRYNNPQSPGTGERGEYTYKSSDDLLRERMGRSHQPIHPDSETSSGENPESEK